ncbi:hypothetical protein ACFX13_004997 [Malus domestica]
MRHSTLVPWLQKGQLKMVSSLSFRFLGGGFADDFLFPIAQNVFCNISISSLKVATRMFPNSKFRSE